MQIAAFIGILILVVWFFSDRHDKQQEINSDSKLAQGLQVKYPLLYNHVLHELEFTLKSESKTEISLGKVLHGIDMALHVQIVYQSGNRIQIVQQAYRLNPKKYLTTKSYFHSSTLDEDALIRALDLDVDDFLNIMLEKRR